MYNPLDTIDPGEMAAGAVNAIVPSKKTLLIVWGTLSITLLNFGYFTGGFYVLKHFQKEYFAEQEISNTLLMEKQYTILERYSQLDNKVTLQKYVTTAEILCTITKHPKPMWSFWSAFDFSVSIITTVGYGVLHPKTWLGYRGNQSGVAPSKTRWAFKRQSDTHLPI